MTGFWRNPGIKREFILYFIILIVCVGTSAVLADGRTALLVFITFLMGIIVHFIIVWRSYRQLARFSDQLDEILHQGVGVEWEDYQEGELAILYTQLKKLLWRMQEQSEGLQKDKLFLADSLADISHQIKTPSTSIRLLLGFLQEDNVTEERRREIAREITRLLERIDWLIYALLKLSRLDAGVAEMKRERVSVRDMVQKAYEPLAAAMDIRNLTWQNEAEDTDAGFVGDLSWSVEALGNILKNCMEHTPSGGSIFITARENAIYTEVVVSDTGEGIAPEDMPHLFERFYRGRKSDSQSVGIGLSLSQRIVHEQNGVIRAGNRTGGGAEFVLRFYKTVV